MGTKTFYADLEPMSDYSRMVESRDYRDLPRDWVLLLTDVKSSTRAIEEGRYKEVNMVGVSTIIAVQNALGEQAFPFVFGGDGATLAVPGESVEVAKRALSHARKVAQASLGLSLRIAVIEVEAILKAGAQLKVGKLRVSATQSLAVLRGDGWTLAEKWMKEREGEFGLAENVKSEGEFTGLECRWNPLPARKDEIMALIIQARVTGERAAEIYRNILHEILGPDMRPLSLGQMKLKWPPRFLTQEAALRVPNRVARIPYLLWNYLKVMLLKLYVHWRDRDQTKPVQYLQELTENTDYLKFDDCLRMVVDVSATQKAQLLRRLDEHVRKGEIFYGQHCDPCALLTCYIQGPQRHIHFVDAAGGGYAMAAKRLKASKKAV